MEEVLTWYPGETGIRSFNVQIHDDNIIEPDERFKIRFDSRELNFGGEILPRIIDNDGRVRGDLNRDGCFDSSDLSIAFQNPILLDLNNNGEFTDDLIRLFQEGHYGKCN